MKCLNIPAALVALASCAPPAENHAATAVPPDSPTLGADAKAVAFKAGAGQGVPEGLAAFCGEPGGSMRPFAPRDWTSLPLAVVNTQVETALERPLRCVVRTAAEWEQLRRQGVFSPPADTVTVDFTREMLVVAARGLRPNTGYGITFLQVFRRGDTVAVAVANTDQPTGSIVGDLPVQPVVTARVASAPEVLFVEP